MSDTTEDQGYWFTICSTYPGAEIRLSIEPHFFDESETVISIREWFETMDGEWVPTRKGINIPYTLDTYSALLMGLYSLSEGAGVKDVIIEDIIKHLGDSDGKG